MDDICRVKINDVIFNSINIKLAVMSLCASLDKEAVIKIVRHVCEETKVSLIDEIVSEDHDGSLLRELGHDPKDIANEIARQVNIASINIVSDVEAILDEEDEDEEE